MRYEEMMAATNVTCSVEHSDLVCKW